MLESKEKRTGRILGKGERGVSCSLYPVPLASVCLHHSFPSLPRPSPPAPTRRTPVSVQAGSVEEGEGVIENKTSRHTCQRVSHVISFKALPIHSRTMYSKIHLSHGGLWTVFATPNLEWKNGKEISKRLSKVIYQTVRRSSFKDHPVG